ncbi:uncharacterized protein RCC_08858 [Ramularia collo-cygni]|uniref:Uncharacterized protein n=1 Tax=Ramularia collo-cygni TaxID=112498 RepID=A0A2D3VN66_9PEZI|nr:uncharacterized protein RCC_08858 [Ramularia collo-cygni]CZT23148.1 uncharacterized protein RCC_08858 [Ramularia collo-cygni]
MEHSADETLMRTLAEQTSYTLVEEEDGGFSSDPEIIRPASQAQRKLPSFYKYLDGTHEQQQQGQEEVLRAEQMILDVSVTMQGSSSNVLDDNGLTLAAWAVRSARRGMAIERDRMYQLRVDLADEVPALRDVPDGELMTTEEEDLASSYEQSSDDVSTKMDDSKATAIHHNRSRLSSFLEANSEDMPAVPLSERPNMKGKPDALFVLQGPPSRGENKRRRKVKKQPRTASLTNPEVIFTHKTNGLCKFLFHAAKKLTMDEDAPPPSEKKSGKSKMPTNPVADETEATSQAAAGEEEGEEVTPAKKSVLTAEEAKEAEEERKFEASLPKKPLPKHTGKFVRLNAADEEAWAKDIAKRREEHRMMKVNRARHKVSWGVGS